ncbi:MAG: phosphopantetheine-binding protein [Bacteroidales bacterium]
MTQEIQEEIITKINELLAEEFETDIEQIKPDALLLETLEMDSLDLVDVVVIVDHNFGVTLTGADFVGIKTFRDFYNLIIRKICEKQ